MKSIINVVLYQDEAIQNATLVYINDIYVDKSSTSQKTVV